MTEPHPLRCETCDHHRYLGGLLHKCLLEQYGIYATSKEPAYRDIPESVMKWNEWHGCASHSAANTSAEKVLDELEKWLNYGWHDKSGLVGYVPSLQVVKKIAELRVERERR